MDTKKLIESEEAKEGLICLKYTQNLDEDALRHPKWIETKSHYDDFKGLPDKKFSKAQVSIYNAILCHDRQVFCITRDDVLKLIRNDKNHENSISNRDWSRLLKLLFKNEIIKKIQGKQGKPWIVEVIDPILLKHLERQTREEQLTECNDFINRKKSTVDKVMDEDVDGLLDKVVDGVTKYEGTKELRRSNSKKFIDPMMHALNEEMSKLSPPKNPPTRPPGFFDKAITCSGDSNEN